MLSRPRRRDPLLRHLAAPSGGVRDPHCADSRGGLLQRHPEARGALHRAQAATSAISTRCSISSRVTASAHASSRTPTATSSPPVPTPTSASSRRSSRLRSRAPATRRLSSWDAHPVSLGSPGRSTIVAKGRAVRPRRWPTADVCLLAPGTCREPHPAAHVRHHCGDGCGAIGQLGSRRDPVPRL